MRESVSHDLLDRSFEDLEVGMTASYDITISHEDIREFSSITGDLAPVHFDPDFAASMGYRKPVAFGLLVFARFSGLLGMVLPGPRSVIHASSFSMKKPVYAEDRLTYIVEITRVVKSVKVVFLSLKVLRDKDDLVLQGETRCGFVR